MRELIWSRSAWILLISIGPLVGISFLSAVRTYSEVSGLNGGPAGVGQALSPLIGVWAPSFSACELTAVFLLPFVAISLVSNDRHSGALKIELQQPLWPAASIAAKAIVLFAFWIAALLPSLSSILLWKLYGGTLYPPELATLVLGHLLNAGLTISLATATASIAPHHSTAAILTLGVTVGSWILSFMGAIQGGLWELAAHYTPAVMVNDFQHGLIQLSVLIIALLLILTGLLISTIWIRLGRTIRQRSLESLALVIFSVMAIFSASYLTPSWDASESRANSFPISDERLLKSIRYPLRIEVHLAQEDPRRVDLETRALSKLRRILPNLQIHYIAATSIGLFEQANPGYGEIWYKLAGRKIMNRTTTVEGVLEAIYSVAGVHPPPENDSEIFQGHPLATNAPGASTVFYLLWPVFFVFSAILAQRSLK